MENVLVGFKAYKSTWTLYISVACLFPFTVQVKTDLRCSSQLAFRVHLEFSSFSDCSSSFYLDVLELYTFTIDKVFHLIIFLLANLKML